MIRKQHARLFNLTIHIRMFSKQASYASRFCANTRQGCGKPRMSSHTVGVGPGFSNKPTGGKHVLETAWLQVASSEHRTSRWLKKGAREGAREIHCVGEEMDAICMVKERANCFKHRKHLVGLDVGNPYNDKSGKSRRVARDLVSLMLLRQTPQEPIDVTRGN